MSLGLLCFALLASPSPTSASEAPAYAISWVRPLDFNEILTPRFARQRSSPLVVSDTIYLGTRLGDVWSFDRRRGAVHWKTELGDAIDAEITSDQHHLYAGTVSGYVHALNRQYGQTKWSYRAGHEVQGALTVAGDLLLFTTVNNQVFALNRESGDWQWQYSEGPDPDLSIRGVAGVAVDGQVAYTGFSNGVVAKLGLDDGRPVWKKRLEGTGQFHDIDATPVVKGGRVYAVIYGNRLVALDSEDGETLWSQSVASHDAPVVVDGRVYLAGLDGALHAFDAATGSPDWTARISDEPLAAPVLNAGRLYVSNGKNGIVVVDPASGKILWRYQGAVSGVHSAPAFDSRDGVYVATNLGHLYRFHPVRAR